MTPDRRWRLKQAAFLGVVVGLWVSQYHPLWGDTQQLRAAPWTMMRKTLVPTHVPLFVLLSLGIGYFISYLRNE